MDKLFSGGIMLAVLIGFWDKIKSLLWHFASYFICHYRFDGEFYKFGATLAWDKLKNKASLSPIYAFDIRGSGKDIKVFIREVGFKNFRFIMIGKVPCLVRIGETMMTDVYSLKPFLNHEKIMLSAIDYYTENYLDVDNDVTISKFQTEYIRGRLNRNNRDSSNSKVEETTPEAEGRAIGGYSTFRDAEKLDLGRRINFTEEEYKRYITFTDENETLLDNLHLTENMNQLKNKLTKWFNNKKWFTKRSIQWKRGVLIHGSPGTGKTSLIAALGEYFNVPVFIFDLSTFTNEDMHNQWNRIKSYTPCFVVFEDFDSVFDGRTNVYSKNAMNDSPISFDCVLNTLDGAVKFDGIVTFITTNNIDKIDSALGGGGNTRPGRIDYVYQVDGLTEETKEFIMNKIFDEMPNVETLRAKALEVECTTPAQFKEACINVALESYDDVITLDEGGIPSGVPEHIKA